MKRKIMLASLSIIAASLLILPIFNHAFAANENVKPSIQIVGTKHYPWTNFLSVKVCAGENKLSGGSISVSSDITQKYMPIKKSITMNSCKTFTVQISTKDPASIHVKLVLNENNNRNLTPTYVLTG